MCGHTRDPIIYSKFHRNPFRGFGAPEGQNLAFPITLASGFYNSLYYLYTVQAVISFIFSTRYRGYFDAGQPLHNLCTDD